MNWELFYRVCFVVGFAFTALSFLTGTLHFHFHLPAWPLPFGRGGMREDMARPIMEAVMPKADRDPTAGTSHFSIP